MGEKVILVCGGRDYANSAYVNAVLDSEMPDMVIQGGAPGADRLAKQWARARGVHCAQVDAYWEIGRGAGPARNYAMLLLQPSFVIAFPGGRGTEHMIRSARKAGISVIEATKPINGIAPEVEPS